MSTNEVFKAYAKRNVKINVRIIEGGPGEIPAVIIEGDGISLKMISELFDELSVSKKGSKVSISPDGAGSDFFSSGATLGLYIKHND